MSTAWSYGTVSVAVGENGGGTVSIETVLSENQGDGFVYELYKITASPSAGYKFVRWECLEVKNHYDGEESVELTRSHSTNANPAIVPRDWSGEDGEVWNATYTAIFIPESDPDPEPDHDVTVTVYASPNEGGTVSGGGRFSPGDSCTISASANEHYEFTGWTSSNGDTSSSETHTLIVPNGDVLWTAHFKKIRVCVLLGMGNGVLGECDTDIQGASNTRNIKLVDAGYSVTLLAYVASGYETRWRVASWANPDGTTSTVSGTKTSDSVTVTLTDSYIEAYAVWKSGFYGYMRYLDWTANFAPKKLYTFKLEITKGAGLGRLPSISWRTQGIANLVQVVTNTASKYEALVPHGAGLAYYNYDAVKPVVSDASKHEVKKATVVQGYNPGYTSEKPFRNENAAKYLCEQACNNSYGYVIEDIEGYSYTPNGISIAFELGYKTTGELLYGLSGMPIYGSGGTLLHL